MVGLGQAGPYTEEGTEDIAIIQGIDEKSIQDQVNTSKPFAEKGYPLIVLGTAHLSSTPGKRSPDGSFREYRYSREICLRVQKALQDKGIKCFIDYVEDDMPGTNSSQELTKRVSIVNKVCDERGSSNVVYVSIHVNAAASSGWHNATGWCIYTSPGITKSDKIADYVFSAAKDILTPLGKKIRTDWSDGDADQEANFFVLRKTLCPAILTENFFQDCKSDVEWLQSEEGRRVITEIHVKGIERYLQSL